MKLLNDKAPATVAPFLLEHRYLMIVVLLNLPGNALIVEVSAYVGCGYK